MIVEGCEGCDDVFDGFKAAIQVDHLSNEEVDVLLKILGLDEPDEPC